ncbi:hypothetical protein AJ80_09803 [Polytolypa hystricis UAMH7299]|uniref:Uncharacterized protein n=1 Tax=Polytolypa hystricis (strain UAMH7299) TaxID=1447883 RepID=A0A2B7WJ19_POLH7|nr:hypothetical protein AJ80_09803 [Polytolypa hystricis UAMH7299]
MKVSTATCYLFVTLCLFMAKLTHASPVMLNPGSPTLEQRSTYPDRLWVEDHDEAPPTDTGLYAISNANGTLPAFWIHRDVTVPQLPKDISVIPIDTTTKILEKRLPSYVNVYGGGSCTNYRAQIQNPQSGQCYGAFTSYSVISIYIPSTNTGDIFNLYGDDSCQSYLLQLYQFVGCYTSPWYFWSFFPCNICS